MNFKVIPSGQVYVIVFITISLFLAATNIQGGWLYIIDSLLLSLLFFSFITPINQVKRLRFTRSFSKSVYEGEHLEVEIEVGNPSKKIVSFIEILDVAPKRKTEKAVIAEGQKSARFFIEIGPGEKVVFTYKLIPEIRGIYTFEKFIITSYGPFGLFKFSRRLEARDEILVYPNLPVLNSLFLSGLKGAGYKYSSKTRHNIEASLPYNIREYRRGDNKKLIHWRSTARLSKLMVKELENEQSLSIQILFDTEKGCNFGSGKESNFEYLLKFAGAILKFCSDKDYKVEFIYYDNNKVQKMTEVTPWKQVLDTFAYLDTHSKSKVRELLKEKEIDFNSIIIPFFLKPEDKDIEVLQELYNDSFSVIPVFSEINSFDKNTYPVKDVINKCPFKAITIKKGEDFRSQVLV
jgi:uncharacterized protein (DUF58 family)